MSIALQITANATGGTHGQVPASSTRYAVCASAGLFFNATEAKTQIAYHEPGVMDQLAARTLSVGKGIANTLTLRINGDFGNSNISIPNSSTAYWEDNTNTDTIADGDLVNFSLANATLSTTTVEALAIHFTPTDTNSTFVRYAAVNFHNLWGTGKDSAALSANVVAASSTEARHQCRMAASGTLSNLFLRLTTNSRGGVDAGIRINGVDGNLFIDTGNAGTGVFEDTTNTDVVVEGDLVNYHFDGGAIVGFSDTITMDMLSVEWRNTNNQYHVILSPPGGSVFAPANNPGYFPIGGGSQGAGDRAAEADVQIDLNHAAELRRLAVYEEVSGAAGQVVVRKNSVDTSLLVNISANGTGIVFNGVDGVVFAANDDLSLKVTGLANFFTTCLLVTDADPRLHVLGKTTILGKATIL